MVRNCHWDGTENRANDVCTCGSRVSGAPLVLSLRASISAQASADSPGVEDSCLINHEAKHSLTSSKGPAPAGFFPGNTATKPATLLTSRSRFIFVDLGITSDCLWLSSRMTHKEKHIWLEPGGGRYEFSVLRSDDPGQADLELQVLLPSFCLLGLLGLLIEALCRTRFSLFFS